MTMYSNIDTMHRDIEFAGEAEKINAGFIRNFLVKMFSTTVPHWRFP